MDAKACAPANIPPKWENINFTKAREYVKKLQVRIVKAQQEGKHNKVKALQWLLTHSFYAKALAVKRVTENKGKRTSGVDHVLWTTPNAKFEAIAKLNRRGYKPAPLKRVNIPKANGKLRPLSIPTMRDRAMQTLYKLALEPIAETPADPNSYGFRTGRCTHDAIEQCFSIFSRHKSAQWILEGDIKGCFDNISHKWILEHIPMDKEILLKFLKSGFIETGRFFPTEVGTPQGGTISPIICNMVLDGIEKELKAQFFRTHRKGKWYAPKVHLVRYADDFIVTSESRELLEKEVLPTIEKFMKKRGLALSPEKTVITHIDGGFDFLGCNIRKYKGKLLIKPSKKNTKTFLDKVRGIIKLNKSVTQEMLIMKLNPVIRGWAEYHKYIVAKHTFNRVDYEIWQSLWNWAKRRHPKKGKRWIAKKYFHRIGFETWVFSIHRKEPAKNDIQQIRLVSTSDIEIRRFVKIKSQANPFDIKWTQYFEERETDKMRISLKGRKILTKLYRQQKGYCPVCQEKITLETDFKVHDAQAGNQTVKLMLHPQCHNVLHSLKIKAEPVLAIGL